MAVRSVIEIDTQDESFRSFQKLFDKYQAQLTKSPSAWAAVSKENKAAEQSFQRMTAALLAQAELTRRVAKSESDAEKAARSQVSSWTMIGRSTKSVAGNISAATKELLKWSGITTALAGLLGVGGLFGIERLAQTGAAGRRSSTGLGLSFGSQQAFGTTYGRYVDSSSFLGSVSEATGNVASPAAAALYALGINPQGGDTAQVAARALARARELAKQTPANQLGVLLQSRGLGELGLTTEDLRRLRSSSPQEFAQIQQQYAQRKNALGLDDKTLKNWQDLNSQLETAGKQIEKVFIDGLAPLAPQIAELSDSFADLVSSMLGSTGFKEGVKSVAEGIHEFADYIKTPEFRESVKEFVTDIELMAQKMVAALKFLGLIPDNGEPAPKAVSTKTAIGAVATGAGVGGLIAGPPGAAVGAGIAAVGVAHANATGSIIDDQIRRTGGFVDPNTGAWIPMSLADQPLAAAGGAAGAKSASVYAPIPSGPAASGAYGARPGANNPGNLRMPGGGAFRSFATPEAGIQGMADQLRRDEYVHGQDTLRKLIYGNEQWPGYTTTDRDAYLSNLVKATGHGADEKLDLKDNDQLAALIAAMTRQETGKTTYTPKAVVTVLNQTGGNAVVQTSQMGFPQ